MAGDELSTYYADLLDGSYDCVDRIVLNAHCGLCYSAGGFRTWWRRWHDDSDAELDDTHLMRMAGRFSRRVRGWAKSNSIPVRNPMSPMRVVMNAFFAAAAALGL